MLHDQPEFRRWREEATRALEGSRLQAGADLHNWACFSAEQAAQLAVKGLLHGVGRAPWGHDLVRLGAEIKAAGIDTPEEVASTLRRLSRHYIPARYPDAHPEGPPGTHYGATDSEEAVTDAESILHWVDDAWSGLDG